MKNSVIEAIIIFIIKTESSPPSSVWIMLKIETNVIAKPEITVSVALYKNPEINTIATAIKKIAAI